MKEKSTSFLKKVALLTMALLMFTGVALGIGLPMVGEKEASAANSTKITTTLTAIDLINDTGIKIDSWSFNSVNIPGNYSTYSAASTTSEYRGSNKKFSNSYFKCDWSL